LSKAPTLKSRLLLPTFIFKTINEMSNLIETIREYVSPDLLTQAAQLHDENENGISKAIGGLVPTILAGLLQKSNDSGAMSSIFNLLSNFDPGVLANPASLLQPGNLAHNDPKDASGQLLGMLFGSKVPAMTSAISSFAGVKSATTSSLLGLAGPLIMGVLSKKISSGGLNLSGLANLLKSESNSILGFLPTGLSAVLGLTTPGTTPTAVTPMAATTGNRWLWPLLLLLGLGAAIMYYMKNCRMEPAVVQTEEPVLLPAPTPAPVAAPTMYYDTLPGGYHLQGALEGIESQLVAFIKDNSRPVDKTTWFNFDHLNFKTGSADLDLDYSQQQLSNMYEVLKAFPQVKIKIGGYTDNVGQEAANQKLSQARAETVQNALIKMGIAKNRLAAEGYGSQHPVAGNDTEEGRAQNRRTAVRVTEK